MSIPRMNMYSDQLIQSELRYMNRDRYQSLRLLRTDNTAQVKQFVASETIRQIPLTRKEPSTTSCNIEDMTTNPLRRQKYQVSSGKDADPTRSSGRESLPSKIGFRYGTVRSSSERDAGRSARSVRRVEQVLAAGTLYQLEVLLGRERTQV